MRTCDGRQQFRNRSQLHSHIYIIIELRIKNKNRESRSVDGGSRLRDVTSDGR